MKFELVSLSLILKTCHYRGINSININLLISKTYNLLVFNYLQRIIISKKLKK